MSLDTQEKVHEGGPVPASNGGKDGSQLFLAFLIGAFVIKGLLFALFIPPWQGPDEPANLAAIAQVGRAPGFDTTGPGGFPDSIRESAKVTDYWRFRAWPWDFDPAAPEQDKEMFFVSGTPSIYNYIAFPAFRAGASLGVLWAMYSIRLLSIIFGALTVLFVYLMTRDAKLGGKWLPILATSLVAFVPQFGFITSIVNKDSLATLLGTAFMWAVVSEVRQPGKKNLFLAAGLLTAAVLTKPSLLALGVPALLALIGLGYRSVLKSRIRFVLGLSVLVGVVALLGLTMVVRDSALARYLDWTSSLVGAPGALRAGADPGMWIYVLSQSWGDFGWLSAPLPRSVYIGLFLLTGFSIVGLAVFAVRQFRSLLRRDYRGLMVLLVLVSSVLSFAVVLAAAQASFGAQGRWWFPVIGPFAILFSLGLSTLVPRLMSVAGSALWIGSWLSLNLWVLVHQLPDRFGIQ